MRVFKYPLQALSFISRYLVIVGDSRLDNYVWHTASAGVTMDQGLPWVKVCQGQQKYSVPLHRYGYLTENNLPC